ncbi:MAG: GDP-mannose 4,6-dehydratase, partial [Thermoplasmata archaeon]
SGCHCGTRSPPTGTLNRGRIMDWTGLKVLVTGAGGFIGSHLVEELIDLGAQVTAFVRYTSQASVRFLSSLGSDLRIVAGDLTEFESVYKAMGDQEYVFHLGALIGVPYSFVHPREVVQVNTIGTLNVLSAARETRPRRVVLTSTSEVYGTARYVPIDEDHPLQAQSPYAASKIAADKLGEAFHHSYDLPVAIVRPFNTFGPRQSLRAVIPTIIVQALGGGPISLGATSPTRDFTFVKDTVRGLVRNAEVEEAIGEVINLGTGQEMLIGDIAKKIASIINRDIRILTDEKRLRPGSSEVHQLRCNNTKAERLLAWKPRFSLEEGLRQTIDWLKKSDNLEDPRGYHI